jgi:GMP synthase PP-ATPase subunit
VEKRLANIYEREQSDIRGEFCIGKLYGVRGDIVRHGHDPVIQARVLDFMAAVYWDLPLDTLKLAPHRAADEILKVQDIYDWFLKPRATTA